MRYEHMFIYYRRTTDSRIVITIESNTAGAVYPDKPGVGFVFVSSISSFTGVKE